jgi:hypothetical protein
LNCETARSAEHVVYLLSAEKSPALKRASFVTLMFCGVTIGSTRADLIASKVLERYG